MLSRVRKSFRGHTDQIGSVLVGLSFLWLIGAAGADDAAVMLGASSSVLALFGKTVLGLLGMVLGVLVASMKGDEDDGR